jgi:hypothetical protein
VVGRTQPGHVQGALRARYGALRGINRRFIDPTRYCIV